MQARAQGGLVMPCSSLFSLFLGVKFYRILMLYAAPFRNRRMEDSSQLAALERLCMATHPARIPAHHATACDCFPPSLPMHPTPGQASCCLVFPSIPCMRVHCIEAGAQLPPASCQLPWEHIGAEAGAPAPSCAKAGLMAPLCPLQTVCTHALSVFS